MSHDESNVNLFAGSRDNPIVNDIDFSSLRVWINGELTNQSADNISFNENDDVIIDSTNGYYPPIYCGTQYGDPYYNKKEKICVIKSIVDPLPPIDASCLKFPDQWTDYAFSSDHSELQSVCGKLFINNPTVDRLSNMFYHVPLTSIPEDFFEGCKNLTTLYYTFCFTTIASIPEKLFNNYTKLNLRYTFSYSDLTSIPENIFATLIDNEDFEHTFANTQITSIPEGLFASNVNIKAFTGTFANCYDLTSVPEKLFANNINVKSFKETFQNCGLTTIPEDLFANNVNVTSFDRTFYMCRDFTKLPWQPFKNNKNVNNFRQTFDLFGGLQTVRHLIEMHSNVIGTINVQKFMNLTNKSVVYTNVDDPLYTALSSSSDAAAEVADINLAWSTLTPGLYSETNSMGYTYEFAGWDEELQIGSIDKIPYWIDKNGTKYRLTSFMYWPLDASLRSRPCIKIQKDNGDIATRDELISIFPSFRFAYAYDTNLLITNLDTYQTIHDMAEFEVLTDDYVNDDINPHKANIGYFRLVTDIFNFVENAKQNKSIRLNFYPVPSGFE